MPLQSPSLREPATPCAATMTTATARPSRPRRATTRTRSLWTVVVALVLALVALGHIAMGPILALAKKSSSTPSDTVMLPTTTTTTSSSSSKVAIVLPTFSISLTLPHPLFPAPVPTASLSMSLAAANQTEAMPTATPTATTASKTASTSMSRSGSEGPGPTEAPEAMLFPKNRRAGTATTPMTSHSESTSSTINVLRGAIFEAPTVDDPTADSGRDAPMPAVVPTVATFQLVRATSFPTGWDMLVQIGGGQSAALAQNASIPAPANRRPAVVAKSGSSAATPTPTPTLRANVGPGQTSPNDTNDDSDDGTGRLTAKKNGTALTDDGIAATCGNGQCDAGETCTNCWADCGVVVGNMLIACDLGWQRCKNSNKTVLIMTNQTNENAPLPTDLLKQYPIHVVNSSKPLTVYPFLQPDANLTDLDAHPGITSLVYVATAGNLNTTVSWFVQKGWRIVSARECRVGADRAPLIWDNPLSLDLMGGVKADDVEARVIAEQGRLLLKSLKGEPPASSGGARSVEWGAVGWTVVLAAAIVGLA
ncbi:hypothetical protein GGF31_000545 [Allomyces arbusculus]|nr:hypothetical protein GGF31_000545 [Allomyces arbusculus]